VQYLQFAQQAFIITLPQLSAHTIYPQLKIMLLLSQIIKQGTRLGQFRICADFPVLEDEDVPELFGNVETFFPFTLTLLGKGHVEQLCLSVNSRVLVKQQYMGSMLCVLPERDGTVDFDICDMCCDCI
jgi:hypothetical protein